MAFTLKEHGPILWQQQTNLQDEINDLEEEISTIKNNYEQKIESLLKIIRQVTLCDEIMKSPSGYTRKIRNNCNEVLHVH